MNIFKTIKEAKIVITWVSPEAPVPAGIEKSSGSETQIGSD